MAQIKKEHIKQDIIKNSIKLFKAKGYSNTTIAQIARASKISVGNVYKYFKDKYEIFRTIVSKEFMAEMGDILNIRTVLNVKRLHEELTPQELAWYDDVYYPFFINNSEQCILLANFSKGTDYELAINSMAKKIMEIKKQEYAKYGKNIISDEFSKLSSMIIMSNVELYVRIMSSKEKDSTKIELLKLADEYHIQGINNIYYYLNKKENE